MSSAALVIKSEKDKNIVSSDCHISKKNNVISICLKIECFLSSILVETSSVAVRA